MTARFKVMQTEHLHAEAAQWLAARCDLVACAPDDPNFEAELGAADGLIVRTYTIVDEAMLSRAPKLKVVGRAGVGLDNIDLEACKRRCIRVVNTPDANTQAVVEYVIALLCDALRPRMTLGGPVDAVVWNSLRADTCAARQMSELTLGILGLGRIGCRVAEIATVIGFTVLYNDLIVPEPACAFASSVPVEELFSQSDVISIHIDARTSNRNFINANLIDRMKSDAVFVNTARGFVVDTAALATFLRANPAAAAHLDVHDSEPFGEDYPLLGLPNAKLYPHLASRTETAMRNMSWVVRDVWAALNSPSGSGVGKVL